MNKNILCNVYNLLYSKPCSITKCSAQMAKKKENSKKNLAFPVYAHSLQFYKSIFFKLIPVCFNMSLTIS